jgi:hypothetical protein
VKIECIWNSEIDSWSDQLCKYDNLFQMWAHVMVWGGGCRNTRIRKVWDMVPLCIFWCIWWERNARCFEGMERNVLELKGLVLRTLMEWSKAAGVLVFSSALDFLESCNA